MKGIISWLLLFTTWLVPAFIGLHAQPMLRQSEPVAFTLEEIGVDQGLSQGMIHGLDVDLKGYLWIATKDGLNRYDGSHFLIFHHDPQNPNSIASNYIRSLRVDDRGLIWAGTNADGLDLYNPANEEFIHFGKTSNPSSASNILSVAKIFSAPSGMILIWDGSFKNAEVLIPKPGADPFHPDSWQIKSLNEVFPNRAGYPVPTNDMMIGFATDGALLFVAGDQLCFLYPDKIIASSPGENNHPHDTDLNLLYEELPVTYFMDHQRKLYAVDQKQKIIYRWDDKAGKFQPLYQLPVDYTFSAFRIFPDSQDRIWQYEGLSNFSRIDLKEGTVSPLKVIRSNSARVDPLEFDFHCEDQQHNIWAGTSGKGLVKISRRNDEFIRLLTYNQSNLSNSISRNGTSFNVDDDFSLSMEDSLREKLKKDFLMPISMYARDSLHQLWCLVIDSRGLPQLCLLRIDPADLSYKKWPASICEQSNFQHQGSVMIDRSGELWTGIECAEGKASIGRIDHPGEKMDVFDFPVEVIPNEHAFITDWYIDPQNIHWLGTKQGLFSFHPGTNQWKHFQFESSRSNSLSNNHVLSICPDPKSPGEYLWIGTDGGGLNRFDISANSFQHFTTANGLPNNVVYSVQSDAHDQLWLSTNLGLCRFDPLTSSKWAFTVEDGLQSNEFNREYYGKDKQGRLYFGGVQGLNRFDPEVFYAKTNASPIVINRLKLSNKEVGYIATDEMGVGEHYHLPAPIENCPRLTFPYTERMITLGFSLLDFTNPHGNKYRYKLEGFKDEWIEAANVNEAVFTNLNPVHYTFLVSGCNSNNIWSGPASLQLIILSPWWATWWFRTLMLLAIAAVIYTFYQYRLRQAMKLQELRNRIAADLHDEIGSTLSSISLAGTVIQHKLKDQHPEVKGFLEKINDNTQKMMEAMSDIVWAVNTKNDRFEQVLHRMRAFAIEILEPIDVMVHFDVSPSVSYLLLDMQQRKNLYLIFKEVIHNVAKYAHGQNAWITLHHTHGQLTMKVRDDGVGITLPKKEAAHESETSLGGNGIQNMRHRAAELKGKLDIQTSPGHGTEVILNFPV